MKKEHDYFDKPENLKRLRLILYGLCVLLIVLDLFLRKHAVFKWEGWFGFYCIYGFLSYALLVVAATKWLRPLVKRDEDHYDE